MKKLSHLFSIAAGIGFCTNASAVIVHDDNFTDNDRTVNPAWHVIGNPAAVVINQSAGVFSLGRTTAGSHTYMASHWAGTTLAVGDQLEFSFRTAMTGNPGNRPNEIVFAIGNNNGTTVATDNDTASYVDDFGYFGALGFGTGVSSIFRDTGGASWNGRPGTADNAALVSSGAGAMSLTNSFKDYTMTISRTATGLDLSLSDGINSIAISDNSVPNGDFYTFNSVTFGYYNRNNTHFLDVDSISVDYTPIPEPGAFAALAGLAALGFVVRLRRKRA